MPRPTVIFVNTRPSPGEAEPCYVAAAKLGLDVVLLADRPVPIQAGWARETVLVDTFDFGELVRAASEVAERRAVRGVVCWGDRDVEGVAAIAAALGMAGNSPAAAARCRNKGLLREALREHAPDLAPRFHVVRTESDLVEALSRVSFPAILKPAGASASKGIFAVDDEQGALSAFDRLMEFASPAADPIFRHYPGELMLEQLIEGQEVSVEGIVESGKLVAMGVTDKEVRVPYFTEYLQLHPSGLPEAVLARLHDAVVRVVDAVGLGTTAFHAEFRITPEGNPVVVEVNGRTGGGYITTHLIPMSRGYDFLAATLVAACRLGQVGPIPDAFCVAGSRKILSGDTGRLREVRGIDRALEVPGVLSFMHDLALGRAVAQPPADYTSGTIGSLLARGTTHAEVCQALELAEGAIEVVVNPDSNEEKPGDDRVSAATAVGAE